MFRFGMKSDTIQFWLLILTGIGLLTGFAGWADSRYAKTDQVKLLRWEVHALYLSIPDSKRIQIEKAKDQFEIDSNESQ